jgi:hypothetical protein
MVRSMFYTSFCDSPASHLSCTMHIGVLDPLNWSMIFTECQKSSKDRYTSRKKIVFPVDFAIVVVALQPLCTNVLIRTFDCVFEFSFRFPLLPSTAGLVPVETKIFHSPIHNCTYITLNMNLYTIKEGINLQIW